jgi:hypothetical protein
MGDAHECAKNPSERSKNIIKHTVFESIRYNHSIHSKQYGQTVLACDFGSWRYEVFPQYKHSRKIKKEKDDSGINWEFVNAVKAEIISDLDKYFPFPIISLKDVEGDDIIGVLVKYVTENSNVVGEENIFGDDVEDILITSTDGDNYQLHALGKHIKQWSPATKKLVRPDDYFVNPPDKRLIMSAKKKMNFVAAVKDGSMKTLPEYKNYLRNKTLICYGEIPLDIQKSIISTYIEKTGKKLDKMKLMNYFASNGFSNLYGNITDFFK